MSSKPDSTANQLHQGTRINSLAPWVDVRTEGAGARYLAQCPTGVSDLLSVFKQYISVDLTLDC